MWTRAALETKVEKLATEHEGEALVDAVRRFGEQLDADERALLGQVLLERAPRAHIPPDYPRWAVILPRRWRRH